MEPAHHGRQVFARCGRATEPVAERPGSQGAADFLDSMRRLVAGEHGFGGVGERFSDRLAMGGWGIRPFGGGVVEGQVIPGEQCKRALSNYSCAIRDSHSLICSPSIAADDRTAAGPTG